MNRKFVAITLIVLCLSQLGYGQQKHTPKKYIDEEGRLYWNKSMPVYLFVSPNQEDIGHRLKSKITEKYADPLYLDVEGLNYIRSQYAVDPVTKLQAEPKTEIHYEIYADGLSPVSEISLKEAKIFRDTDNTYYGPGLTASFSATDQTSGVENIFYSSGSENFSVYNDLAFTIQEEGKHSFSYYAVDHVGNAEKIRTKEFILDKTPPFTNLNINGVAKDNIISENSTLYFLISDSLSGVKKTFYAYDDAAGREYVGGKLSVKELKDGNHKLSYYSEDRVGNIEEVKTFEFYLDNSAPLMVSDVLGDRFIVDKKVYFSGRTKLKLTAIDNKIGVKDILYSIDGEPFVKYEQPFYLPSISGNHEIRYYSVDKLDNKSTDASSRGGGYEKFKHNVSKVYIDLTGPTMKKPTFKGLSVGTGDTLLIGPNSKVNLGAYDPESGLKEITYSIDGEVAENNYDSAFSIVEEGLHRIEYFGYDNVNNRNISDVVVFVDATPPVIYSHFTHGALRTTADGSPVYPNNVGLFLAGTDQKAGLNKIYYSINGQPEVLYDDMIYNFRDNFDFEIVVRAIDILGNESTKKIVFSTRTK